MENQLLMISNHILKTMLDNNLIVRIFFDNMLMESVHQKYKYTPIALIARILFFEKNRVTQKSH